MVPCNLFGAPGCSAPALRLRPPSHDVVEQGLDNPMLWEPRPGAIGTCRACMTGPLRAEAALPLHRNGACPCKELSTVFRV